MRDSVLVMGEGEGKEEARKRTEATVSCTVDGSVAVGGGYLAEILKWVDTLGVRWLD